MQTTREQEANASRRRKINNLLGQMYWRDTPPYPDLAIKAYMVLNDVDEASAKGHLEAMTP